MNFAHLTKFCVRKCLNDLNFARFTSNWFPYHLSPKNTADRLRIFTSLLEQNKSTPFLENLVTCDEKWIKYDNSKRSQKSSKGGNIKKELLSVWWDCKGVIFYELMPTNKTITANVYSLQIDKFMNALKEKRPEKSQKGLIYHHDNARFHVAQIVKDKLAKYECQVLPHPPYSPDAAPSDYFLFRSLKRSLNGRKFRNRQSMLDFLEEYFTSKSPEFYRKGIFKLPEIWQNVVLSGGGFVRNKLR